MGSMELPQRLSPRFCQGTLHCKNYRVPDERRPETKLDHYNMQSQLMLKANV